MVQEASLHAEKEGTCAMLAQLPPPHTTNSHHNP